MNKDHDDIVLEVFSILTGKDLTNSNFIIKKDNKIVSIVDKKTNKAVDITIIHNQIVNILGLLEGGLSSYIIANLLPGGKLICGEMGKNPQEVFDTFSDTENFVLNKDDSLYKKDIESINKAFFLAVNAFAKKMKSDELIHFKINEEKISYYLGLNQLNFEDIEKVNYLLKFKAIPSYRPFNYYFQNVDYFNSIVNQFEECNHTELSIGKYPAGGYQNILCTCSKCNSSFAIDMINRRVNPMLFVQGREVHLDTLIEGQKQLIYLLGNSYILGLSQFFKLVRDLKEVYGEELRLLRSKNKESLLLKNHFGLKAFEDEKTNEIKFSLLGEEYTLYELNILDLEGKVKEILKGNVNNPPLRA